MKKPINHKSRIPRDIVVPFTAMPYDPKLDDYDMPAEFPFDPAKLKPNPYAGRTVLSRGGARKGAGRKPVAEPAESHTVTLYKSDVQALRKLDSNLSRAIRKVIASKAR